MNVLAGALRARRGDRSRSTASRTAPAVAARREPPRHRPDPPGALALPAPDGRREHPDGPRARRAAASSIARAAERHGRASCSRNFPHPDLAAAPDRRRAADCRAAGRRDLPRAGLAGAHPADGRADEQPAARRRRAPVRAHPPAARAGPRDRLHQPLPRGGPGDRRRRSPCCATAGAWRPARSATRPTSSSSRRWSAARSRTCSRRAPGATPGEVVLERQGPRGAAGGAARPASTLRRGEMLGIAGLMGSGRTEMVRAIFGLEPIASGARAASPVRRPALRGRHVPDGIASRRRVPERGPQGRGAGAARCRSPTTSR